MLSSGEPSPWSTQVLQRNNFFELFEENEEAALGELHKKLEPEATADNLFALSELSFYYAEQSRRIEYFRASAVYAHAFLFPKDATPPPNPLDPRRRQAADLYNRSLTRALALSAGDSDNARKTVEIVIEARTVALPFGELDLTLDPSGLQWGATASAG
ncbi:MAG TPA: hypothetical protein VGB25_05500 [Candidatus Binatia bacterium]